jgi:hypothetical protein
LAQPLLSPTWSSQLKHLLLLARCDDDDGKDDDDSQS